MSDSKGEGAKPSPERLALIKQIGGVNPERVNNGCAIYQLPKEVDDEVDERGAGQAAREGGDE